jgi:hypothetical protein
MIIEGTVITSMNLQGKVQIKISLEGVADVGC